MSPQERTEEGIRVVRAEAEALDALAKIMAEPEAAEAFARAVDIILATRGHLVVAGVGKSGHIGLKIAASFASTGTPAFFMHPTEASHGDLGMITANCAVLAISNSGEAVELIDVLHYCARVGVPVIGVTRAADSPLARGSTVVLRLPAAPEACINGLAPTTSTTATLALGDALVVATMAERGLTETEFGRRHPGGKLGRGLKTVGEWLAHNPHDVPTVAFDAPLQEVVVATSEGRQGCVAVMREGAFAGMITDGDLRRAMAPDMFSRTAADIMTENPVTLSEDMAMRDVMEMLTRLRLNSAFVLRGGKPVAVVDIKTLLATGYG